MVLSIFKALLVYMELYNYGLFRTFVLRTGEEERTDCSQPDARTQKDKPWWSASHPICEQPRLSDGWEQEGSSTHVLKSVLT